MKITICGSMTFAPEMKEVAEALRAMGHEADLPAFVDEYAALQNRDAMHAESTVNKVKFDLIRKYYDIIAASDAVLVLNEARKGVPGYIGGNTLIEMGFAHILKKPIFLMRPIPDLPYADEIKAMNPIVIDGVLSAIEYVVSDAV